MVEPDISNKLVWTIIRFRLGKCTVFDDIEQMFYKINVSTKDTYALGFHWRPISNVIVSHYYINVHLLEKNGTSCAANLALKRTGTDKKGNIHPSFVKSIDLDLYMDDSIKWDKSIKDLVIIIKTVISKLKATLMQI